MKLTKLFSIVFSLVTVLGLLAGCATPKPPAANAPTQAPAVEAAPTEAAPAAPTQAATGKVTEITVWSFIQQHLDFFQKMAVIWNEQHPDEQISINGTFIPWAQIHDNLRTAMQAGAGVPEVADLNLADGRRS